ncbi:hypothetical protein LPB86_12690 [Pedobacter sp. MC2016-14]|uniref:hypothetical protein n=1 Tax=Pedobacter sp. MC2016-14 TaxID=2897327 RepID=UPI001E50B80E|nr:hypothetical protein [Pedobacter sp. MC2016-14]MCD0489090.1 hypothetical protein [Pedobacter sp. MC2016-14]
MKKILFCTILVLAILSARNTIAQQPVKIIYFYADTLSINPDLNIIEIDNEGPIFYYSFHCKCMPPYFNNYLTFICYEPRAKSLITKAKPLHKYISLKELLDISVKAGDGFESFYKLSIVEPLPDGNYIESKVKIKRSRKEIIVN